MEVTAAGCPLTARQGSGHPPLANVIVGPAESRPCVLAAIGGLCPAPAAAFHAFWKSWAGKADALAKRTATRTASGATAQWKAVGPACRGPSVPIGVPDVLTNAFKVLKLGEHSDHGWQYQHRRTAGPSTPSAGTLSRPLAGSSPATEPTVAGVVVTAAIPTMSVRGASV